MNNEHYLSKIERNAYVLDKAPMEIRDMCLQNINWARTLASRLEMLDYSEREKAIIKIHEVLDDDYKKMGFTIEDSQEEKIGRYR